jgi:hypothetical protein
MSKFEGPEKPKPVAKTKAPVKPPKPVKKRPKTSAERLGVK